MVHRCLNEGSSAGVRSTVPGAICTQVWAGGKNVKKAGRTSTRRTQDPLNQQNEGDAWSLTSKYFQSTEGKYPSCETPNQQKGNDTQTPSATRTSKDQQKPSLGHNALSRNGYGWMVSSYDLLFRGDGTSLVTYDPAHGKKHRGHQRSPNISWSHPPTEPDQMTLETTLEVTYSRAGGLHQVQSTHQDRPTVLIRRTVP